MAIQGFKNREKRQTVRLPARMRDETGWRDVTICNVSSRGMMVLTPQPPAPGSYVELRRNNVAIVGQVRWREDGAFGMRAQDVISITALSSSSPSKVGEERRQMARVDPSPQRVPSNQFSAEMNRLAGRVGEYLVIGLAILFGCLLLARLANGVLETSMQKASHALDGSAPSGRE